MVSPMIRDKYMRQRAALIRTRDTWQRSHKNEHARSMSALVALDRVYGRAFTPTDFFFDEPLAYGPAYRGGRYVERPRNGLRFVGYSDDIVRLRHRGWFTEDDGLDGQTLRGAVFALPSKRGKRRLIAGYVDSMRVDKKGNVDGAFLDFSELYEDEKSAAFAADSIAEHSAESARDYNRAYSAAMTLIANVDAISQSKRRLRYLLDARRGMKRNNDQNGIIAFSNMARETLDDIEKLRAENEKLKSDYGRECGFRNALSDGI